MPVGFLSEDQAAGHGRFAGVPSRAELEQFFVLDRFDLELIGQRRGEPNRLGFALQVCTVRFLGAFVPVPGNVPDEVVGFVAAQLDIDAVLVGRYADRAQTSLEHQWEIRAALGLVEFSDVEGDLRSFLSARAWTRRERPSELFDHAVVWLRAKKALVPGVTVLERLIAEVRNRVDQELVEAIAERVDSPTRERLDALLVTTPGRLSSLEYLRRAPRKLSGRQLALAFRRVTDISDVGAHLVEVSDIPENRFEALARQGLASDVATLRRLSRDRRAATMVAAVTSLRVTAIDDALDVFTMFMTEKLIRPAERTTDRQRLKGWDALATASATMASTVQRLLELMAETDDDIDPTDDATAWRRLVTSVSAGDLETALRVASEVAPPSVRSRQASVRGEVTTKYRSVA